MKTPLPSWVIKSVIIEFTLSGWTLWAVSRHHATETALNARELEELNEYLLHDIGNFKKKYERVVRSGAADGRGVSDFRLRQTLATLREENGALKTRLDEMTQLHEKELKAALEAKTDGPGQPPAPQAVDLGIISISPTEADFRDKSGAKPEPAPAAAIKAQILSTDEKDEFVVINLGKKSGIERGAEFIAQRGKVTIARLRVIEARDFLSACEVEYAAAGKKLQANDEITLVRR